MHPFQPRARRIALIAALTLLLVASAGLFTINSVAAEDDGQRLVKAVEDITATADCEIRDRTHSDPERTLLLDERVLSCPPGSVLHTSTMTEREAKERGLPYVVLTGDIQADKTRVDQLKHDLGPAGLSGEAAPEQAPPSARGGCIALYRQRSIGYSGGSDPGGYIRTWVYYEQVPSDCGNIHITNSNIRFEQPPNSGADLYWDEQRYPGGGGRDTGCKAVLYLTPTGHTHSPTWSVSPGDWLTEESINDTSLGCSWWGEEFTGCVQLTL